MATYLLTISARDLSPYTDPLSEAEVGAYLEAAALLASGYLTHERHDEIAAALGDDELNLRVRAARRGSVLRLVGSAYRDLAWDLRDDFYFDTHPMLAARRDMLAHIADHWNDVVAEVLRRQVRQ